MSISDRISAARQRLHVGRDYEKALFYSAIQAAQLPFHLLYIYGPGGIGKTSLLNDFGRLSDQLVNPTCYLDARNIEPIPDAFLRALQSSLGLEQPGSALARLGELPGHPVVMIDTYECLEPLDEWLSKFFFPQLPEAVLMVLAGREPISRAWRSDPGWQELTRVLPLRNLNPEESKDYLSRRNIPLEQQSQVLDFTHGHPLALSLIADVFAQRPGIHFSPLQSPDIVKTLLEQFVQKVPSPAHRIALEACALVREMTEALLAEMLGMNNPLANAGAHDLFEWLRSLSFIESGPGGVFPHDLAREALAADLRWRNPDWYAELHQRARNYFMTRLNNASGAAQQAVLFDYIFLHRDNPVVRPFFEWQTGGGLILDLPQPGDEEILLDMVTRQEGPESAHWFTFWTQQAPDALVIIREPEGQPTGLMCSVIMQSSGPADGIADPALRAAWGYLQKRAPLRPGEIALHTRFWMSRTDYQVISPAQSLIGINMVRQYLTVPGLVFSFFPVADPDFWAPLAAYSNLERLPECDYETDGRRYQVFGHDWRSEPPAAWLAMLADREVAQAPVAAPLTRINPIVVLSQDDFATAVQDALRSFTRAGGLAANPLLRSRLVLGTLGKNAGTASEQLRQESLRSLIHSAADSLNATPREARGYRALFHTYFQPALTQEAAAEVLDLPFSTYRRHLKEGINRIIEILWQVELAS